MKGRYVIRRPVPQDIIGRVLGTTGKPLKVIEIHLGTGNHSEARQRTPAAMANIEKRLRRARDGSSAADEALEEIADTEMRHAYDLMAARPFHFESKIATFSEALENDLSAIGMKTETASPFLSDLTIWEYAEPQVKRLEPDPKEGLFSFLGYHHLLF